MRLQDLHCYNYVKKFEECMKRKDKDFEYCWREYIRFCDYY